MKNEIFLLRDGWHVSFNGKTTGTWQEKGPAQACLSLLEKGLGEILTGGVVKWTPALK
jgi:hypothetical protein